MVYVAILGFGVVGSGVAEVLERNRDKIARSAAQDIRLKYILDVRDFPGSPFEKYLIKDFSVIENDPEVRVVVETIGGAGVAYEFTKRSLLAGKSVVTSNKELVATHGCELLALARERNLNYLFEASVGGGIPIIRPISQCLAANYITELYGILNGTTNFILTRMFKDGLSFEDALREARQKGYAEANPAADILGTDACRKICILASLSFGRQVPIESIPTDGITEVTAEDVRFAAALGCKLKLIGRAVRQEDGRAAAYVAPHLIRDGSLLSNVEDVFNGIVVRGNAIGDVMFYGQGAGKLPTASAVVADIIDAVKHFAARKFIDWAEASPDAQFDPALIESEWYVRLPEGAAAEGDGLRRLAAEGGQEAFVSRRMDEYGVRAALGGAKPSALFRILD